MKVVWKIKFGDEDRKITWFSSPKKPIELDDEVMEFLEDYRLTYFGDGFPYYNDQVAIEKEVYEIGTALFSFLRGLDRKWREDRESKEYDGYNMFEIISMTPKDPRFPSEKGTNNYTIY